MLGYATPSIDDGIFEHENGTYEGLFYAIVDL